MSNLFDISQFDLSAKEEIVHSLISHRLVRIERIISYGQISNEWYDQQEDEWVVLLQGNATLIFEEEQQEISMEKGSYLFIPAHKKHKVTFTSKQPPCIWLAIYLNKE